MSQKKNIKRGSYKTAFHEIASCLKRSSEMPYSVVDSYLNEHSGRRKIAIRVIQECLTQVEAFFSSQSENLP